MLKYKLILLFGFIRKICIFLYEVVKELKLVKLYFYIYVVYIKEYLVYFVLIL